MKPGKFRVSRVTTRTGDKGQSSLADGTRMAKDAPQFELLGELDELNATVGVLVALEGGYETYPYLATIQQTLFDVGAEIAAPGHFALDETHISSLEQACKEMNDTLPPLQEFVLPGGTLSGAQSHLCRVVARRAERRMVAVMEISEINPHSLAWINRLSDYFFILSRVINIPAFPNEPQWTGVKHD